MESLFATTDFAVAPIGEGDRRRVLEVYRRREDILSLGPEPTATMAMADQDSLHSAPAGRAFRGIREAGGVMVGALDFIPEKEEGMAVLSLLMISEEHRSRRIGPAAAAALETYIAGTYGTRTIESGVQANNPAGMRFRRERGYSLGTEARDMGDGTSAYPMRQRLP